MTKAQIEAHAKNLYAKLVATQTVKETEAEFVGKYLLLFGKLV